MAMGPSYDPVTRMRSHTETGQMVGDIFRRRRDEPAGPDAARAVDAGNGAEGRVGGVPPAPHRSGPQVGVMVVSIGNLYTLERLHGMAAVNHALFVCAGRLRRSVPAYVETGRFSGDGFVLLLRDCNDSGQLIRLAHLVEKRLSKSVVLNTSLDAARREFREELGVEAPDVAYAELGTFAYASGKRVVVFVGDGSAFTPAEFTYGTFELEWPPRSGRSVAFPEVEDARWVAAGEASALLVKGQRAALEALAQNLREAAGTG